MKKTMRILIALRRAKKSTDSSKTTKLSSLDHHPVRRARSRESPISNGTPSKASESDSKKKCTEDPREAAQQEKNIGAQFAFVSQVFGLPDDTSSSNSSSDEDPAPSANKKPSGAKAKGIKKTIGGRKPKIDQQEEDQMDIDQHVDPTEEHDQEPEENPAPKRPGKIRGTISGKHKGAGSGVSTESKRKEPEPDSDVEMENEKPRQRSISAKPPPQKKVERIVSPDIDPFDEGAALKRREELQKKLENAAPKRKARKF